MTRWPGGQPSGPLRDRFGSGREREVNEMDVFLCIWFAVLLGSPAAIAWLFADAFDSSDDNDGGAS